jgi:hypothetical protein
LSNGQFLNSGLIANQSNNSSVPKNSINGSFSITSIGTLTKWVVPNGVQNVQLILRGAYGGSGGNSKDAYGTVIATGGAGGDCGTFSVVISVNTNDTISVFLGANGLAGNDRTGCSAGTPCQAASGTGGQTSDLYINGTSLVKMYGGTGGTGGYNVVGCGNCRADGNSGTNGTIDTSLFMNNGILFYDNSNSLSTSCNKLIIRY